MNSFNDDQASSSSSDIDVCNTSPSSSPYKQSTTTSTPQETYRPRVNFRSVEALATPFALNTSSLTPISSASSISSHRHDDTGYSSLNSSTVTRRNDEKENHPPPRTTTTTTTGVERKPRRKLADWQVWHLRQSYARSRYPSPYEQEQLAIQLLLPPSSIRIWFQNHRARSGKNTTD